MILRDPSDGPDVDEWRATVWDEGAYCARDNALKCIGHRDYTLARRHTMLAMALATKAAIFRLRARDSMLPQCRRPHRPAS